MPGGRGSTVGSGKGARLSASNLKRKGLAKEIEDFFKNKPGLKKKIENNPELKRAFNRLILEREEINNRLKIKIPISGIYVREISSVIKKIPEIERQIYAKFIIKPILEAGVKERELKKYLEKVNKMFFAQNKLFLRVVNNIISQPKQTVRITKDKQGNLIKKPKAVQEGKSSVKGFFDINRLLQSSRLTKESKLEITKQHKKYMESLKQISEIIFFCPNLEKLENLIKEHARKTFAKKD